MVCKATPILNGAQAASYFEKDNYYTKDGDHSPSQWAGKLAEDLGLAGLVDKSEFLRALNGTMPTGELMRGGGANGKHRPGTDMTFSAPKSVSLLAFAAGDNRVVEAHQQAVAAAMCYAEQHLIVVRLTEKGEVREVQPGNMLAARFLHDTSRNLDPQLHEHFIVLNAARTEDGKLHAIDNHKLFQSQMMLGAIYHTELQRNLENLGYTIEATLSGKNGDFEVAGIDADYIETKSSRRAAIIAALEKRGIDPATATARQLDVAALDTRKAKGEVDHAKLHEEWRTEFAEAMQGFEIPNALNAAQVAARDIERTEQVKAALDWATEHHFERSNAVKREDLIKTAFAESRGATVEQIEAEFDRRIATQDLITDGKRFTTREAVEREETLIKTVRDGQGGVEGIYKPKDAAQVLAEKPLNAGQKRAAGMMMCAEDQFAMVQGVAGSGKTHMLREVRPLLEAEGYKLIGVAPSHQAAGELRSAMGEGMTVQSFNQSPSIHKTLNAKSIIVTDEAGLCDAKTMAQFSAIVKETGARAVFIGDQRQFKAVGAGNPFLLLQEQGIRQAEMNETRRQAPNPYLLETVNLAADGKMKEALARLPVTEISQDSKRHAALADDYMATRASLAEKAAAGDKDAARGAILLTGSNADRRALNDAIRERLGLKGNGEEITVLDRADMTTAEQKLLRSYQPGQVLKFNQPYKTLGVEQGGLLTVDRVEKTGVVCKHASGEEVTFQPNRLNPENWQVLRAEKMEFSIGDEIRFRQNQREQGTEKGKKSGYEYNTNDRGVVTAIDREAGTLTIRNDGKNGRETTLSLSNPQFITHGYAMTGHSAQGATVHSAICDFRGNSLTTSRESFYTDISRATTDVRVYTDDAKALDRNAGRAIEKPNALDVSGTSFLDMEQVVPISKGETTMDREHSQNTDSPQAAKVAGTEAETTRNQNTDHAQAHDYEYLVDAPNVAQQKEPEAKKVVSAELSDEAEIKPRQKSSSGIEWGADGDSYTSTEGNLFVRDGNGDFVSDASMNSGRNQTSQDLGDDLSQQPVANNDTAAMESELQQAQEQARTGNPDTELMAEQGKACETGQKDLESNQSFEQDGSWKQPSHETTNSHEHTR